MYVQIGGWKLYNQPDWPKFRYPGAEKELSKTIFESLQQDNAPVELILGILPSGASYLLIGEHQLRVICEKKRLPYPNQKSLIEGGKFESLSPIHFENYGELTAKLSKHAPKKGRLHQTDTSQANRSFSEPSEEYLGRAIFEQMRLLRLVLKSPTSNFETYQVLDTSRLNNIQVISFAYTQWASDGRLWTEKQSNPTAKHLDVGFAVADGHNLYPLHDKAAHFYNSQNDLLGQRGQQKVDFRPDISLRVGPDELKTRIQQIFLETAGADTIILLVYNQKMALNVIQAYGVVTDTWETGGLKNLLYSKPSRNRYSENPTSHSTRTRQRSSRSRSPRRRDPRPRSPAPDSSRGTVYVVDIQNLAAALFHTGEKPLNDVARDFDFPFSGWNAARDADTLIHIYRAMSDGPSIDQQHELRARSLSQQQQSGPSVSTPSTSAMPDDEETDPNDIVQGSANGQNQGYYSEESEYEDDSD